MLAGQFAVFEDPLAKLYYNKGAGSFQEASNTLSPSMATGMSQYADIDSDGDYDFLSTGYIADGRTPTMIYENQAGLNFERTDSMLPDLIGGSFAFSDVDQDGDQDLLMAGRRIAERRNATTLYFNDGNGVFTEAVENPFLGLREGDIAFGDIDRDGDEDVLVTGWTSVIEPRSNLYINNGAGVFEEDTDVPFQGVFRSAVAFEDVDNDGDNDLLIAGNTTENGWDWIGFTALYFNDGLGGFREAPGTNFPPFEDCDFEF